MEWFHWNWCHCSRPREYRTPSKCHCIVRRFVDFIRLHCVTQQWIHSGWVRMRLDACAIGDRIGVQRTRIGELRIYLNGVDQGVAAVNLPKKVYAVVDLYGKCTKVTVVTSQRGETGKLVCHQLIARRALSPFNDAYWEPEGCYRCSKSMTIVPCWFSMLNSVNTILVLSRRYM